MTTNFLERGTDIIREAVAKDNDEKYKEALSLYIQGIRFLMTGAKYEKNARILAVIREKIITYMTRAEDIKQYIAHPPKKKKMKAKVGGGRSSGRRPRPGDESKSDDDEDMDEETAKLRSALSDAIVIERPSVRWDDVAGLDTAKELLKEAVILPMRFPQLFTQGRRAWTGILLYGPPGTGKSYLGKAVATEANNSTFFSVSSSDLISKYVGESERLIRNLFEMARAKAPSIVFIDEIDSLATKRSDNEQDSTRRVKTELLVQMEGVGKSMEGVLVLGATNCPWDLDPAVRRRFQKRIYIPLPNIAARKAMFKIHTRKADHILSDEDFDFLASRTERFSGSDIASIVQDALMEPIRFMQVATHFRRLADPDNAHEFIWMACQPTDEHAEEIDLMRIPPEDVNKVRAEKLQLNHFLRVIDQVKPSVGDEDLIRQDRWTEQYGQEG